jgi:hypothetical protein
MDYHLIIDVLGLEKDIAAFWKSSKLRNSAVRRLFCYNVGTKMRKGNGEI